MKPSFLAFPEWPMVLLHAMIIGFFIFIYLRWDKNYFQRESPYLKNIFLFTLSLKLLAGISVGLVYLHIYGGVGDTFSLFADGLEIYKLTDTSWTAYLGFMIQASEQTIHLFDITIQNPNHRALFFSKWVSAIQFIAQGNYWLSGLYFSLFSFFGMWFLVKRMNSLFPYENFFACTFFLFLPTVVFWSSGILKESLQMGCIGFLVGISLQSCQGKIKSLRAIPFYLPAFVILSFILFQLKYYYAVTLLPLLLLLLLDTWTKNKFNDHYKKIKWVLLVGGILSIIAGSFLHPNLNPDKILNAIYVNHEKMAQQTDQKENLIVFNDFEPTLISFVKNAPSTFLQGLLRPFPWESGSLLKKIISVERWLLVLFLVYCLSRFEQQKLLQLSLLGKITLIYSFSLLLLLTFAAPNIGTLSRYQISFSPFLLYQFSFLISATRPQ